MAVGPLTLSVFPDVFAVCRLPPDAALPTWTHAESFVSITRTRDELSIVCPQSHVPDGIQAEPGWRCLKVEGPFDLALTGVLASLAGPLAMAGISMFTVATYDTDYLLVKDQDILGAMEALEQAGHHVRRHPETSAGAPVLERGEPPGGNRSR
jgi:hypothetical protein